MKWTILCLALVFAMSSLAFADPDDDAIMEVFVEVDANMQVIPGQGFFDLGHIQMGLVCGSIPFVVDANTQTVKFSAAASHLYKGDDPSDPEVDPILVDDASGICFSATDGNPTGGADWCLPISCDSVINGFPGKCVGWIEFESSQNNRFSQDVWIDVCWDQPDPEKPMGEYSGYVSFDAMIILP